MQDTTFLKCIKKSESSFSYSKPFRANYPALICLALGFFALGLALGFGKKLPLNHEFLVFCSSFIILSYQEFHSKMTRRSRDFKQGKEVKKLTIFLFLKLVCCKCANSLAIGVPTAV